MCALYPIPKYLILPLQILDLFSTIGALYLTPPQPYPIDLYLMCYFVFSQVRFRGILDPTYLNLSTYLSTNLYKFDLKKVGWRGPPLPEWLGIEGKGCKILSRLSLSEGTQLEVSSAHSQCCSELLHLDLCRLCRVTDCLTL